MSIGSFCKNCRGLGLSIDSVEEVLDDSVVHREHSRHENTSCTSSSKNQP
jgi:hypothetical protein